MTTIDQRAGETPVPEARPWFEEVEEIDDRYIQITVVTTGGKRVEYLVPRRTGFHELDDRAAEA